MIQYASPLEIFNPAGDYWIPAFAGMTVIAHWPSRFLPQQGREKIRAPLA
jgi:hypothetical protein